MEKELHETQPVSIPVQNPDVPESMPTKMHPLANHKSKLLLLGIIAFLIIFTGSYTVQYFLQQSEQKDSKAKALSLRPSPTTALQHPSCNITKTTEAKTWSTYRNDRYMFCLLYPPNLQVHPKNETRYTDFLDKSIDLTTTDFYPIDKVVFKFYKRENDRDFNALLKAKIGEDVPEAHHSSNSFVYKTKEFTLGGYPALEYIVDTTAQADRGSGYAHVLAIDIKEVVLIFVSSGASKNDQQKNEKLFSQAISTLTFTK